MKKRLILLKQDDRIYIRDIDIRTLKPLLNLANIEIKTSEIGKHTGVPHHYIPLATGFPFLLSLTKDFELVFR